MNQPLPTDAIDLERQEEPQADYLEAAAAYLQAIGKGKDEEG